jgi:hypothetical protein
MTKISHREDDLLVYAAPANRTKYFEESILDPGNKMPMDFGGCMLRIGPRRPRSSDLKRKSAFCRYVSPEIVPIVNNKEIDAELLFDRLRCAKRNSGI